MYQKKKQNLYPYGSKSENHSQEKFDWQNTNIISDVILCIADHSFVQIYFQPISTICSLIRRYQILFASFTNSPVLQRERISFELLLLFFHRLKWIVECVKEQQ